MISSNWSLHHLSEIDIQFSRWPNTQAIVNDAVSSFAEELDLIWRRSDYHRHSFSVATELQDMQQLVAVFHSFKFYL